MRECADIAADKSKTSHVEGGGVRVGGVRVGGVRMGGVRVGGVRVGGVRVGGVRMGGVRMGGCIPQRSYQSVLVLLPVTLEMKTRLRHCCL